jgi:hypothetical protein
MMYETPFGSFRDWIEAAERCEKSDVDPIVAIKIIREVA